MPTLRTEEAALCLLCGTPGETLFRGLHDRLYSVEGEFGFARCSSCGLVWESPRPTIDEIPKCYPDDYEPHEGEPGEVSIRPAAGVRDVLRALILSEIFGYTRFKRDEWWASVGGVFSAKFLRCKTAHDMDATNFVLPLSKGGRFWISDAVRVGTSRQ